jgi:DNA polymerase-2
VGLIMATGVEGFIVHSYARSQGGRTFLYFSGRLADGSTFAVRESRYRPNFYVRESDAAGLRRVEAALAAGGSGDGRVELRDTSLRTMDGEPCLQASCLTPEFKRALRDALGAAGIRTYEADLRAADQYRLERRIHGPVRIRGEGRAGRLVSKVFLDPELEPGRWLPRLSVLSLDIETDISTQTVLAVGLSHQDPYRNPDGGSREEQVLFLGPRLAAPGIECFSDEKSLLLALAERVAALDPDILTGWNVVNFDFPALAARFERHRIPFRLGRSREPAVYLPQSGNRGSRVIVPGRQVWDGVRIVRASPETFEDYSLETVAESILGYGKRIELVEGESRLQAIERLYRNNPEEFCAYCLQDARLVHQIFARTGLFELTLRRCLLIGVAPDLAWTSIPAFEHLYTEALHRRGLVAPTFGVDSLPVEGASGGIILTPRPGVFDEVLVFDFQSLYPSIIRTFNIDPVSRLPFESEDNEGKPSRRTGAGQRRDPIRAPNGARFRREPGILPELLDRFFTRRSEAQSRGDAIASFVYKIIMNSFYGVLGARGCRFAGAELAGAITSFGQRIVSWCRSFLEERGYTVLYGDTDSLFVTVPRRAAASGSAPSAADRTVTQDGEQICRLVNAALEQRLAAEYRVRPRLTLRFEKKYSRFFLPPLRGVNERTQKGRAKGYAGLLAGDPPAPGQSGLAGRIEIRGMEAVRRDWTDLAHEFQTRLLELLFLKAPLQDFQSYIKEVIEELNAGRLDGKLVYRKALRKPISAYTRSTPPHVKAAFLLPPSDRRGLVRYLVTREGPQPEGRVDAPIDYPHYVEHQLKPIASAFTDALKTDLDTLFGHGGQLWLF